MGNYTASIPTHCPFKAFSFLPLWDLLHCIGFDSLLEAKRLSDLATLYQLLSRIKGGLDELCTAFSVYIKVIG